MLTINATFLGTISDIARGKPSITPSEIESQLHDWFCFALKLSRPSKEKPIADPGLLPGMAKETTHLIEGVLDGDTITLLYATTFFSCFNSEKLMQLWPVDSFAKHCVKAWLKYRIPDLYNKMPIIGTMELSPEVKTIIEKGFDKRRSLCVIEASPTLWDIDPRIRLGICSPQALPGDNVALIRGCRRPVILGRSGDNYYVLIGPVFVQGDLPENAPVEVLEKGFSINSTSKLRHQHHRRPPQSPSSSSAFPKHILIGRKSSFLRLSPLTPLLSALCLMPKKNNTLYVADIQSLPTTLGTLLFYSPFIQYIIHPVH
jgi:hypothetical protein